MWMSVIQTPNKKKVAENGKLVKKQPGTSAHRGDGSPQGFFLSQHISPPSFPFHTRESRMVRTHTRKQTLFIPSPCYTQSRPAWHHAKCYNESSYCDTAVIFVSPPLFHPPLGPAIAFSQSQNCCHCDKKQKTKTQQKPASNGLKKEAQVQCREKKGQK